MREIATLVYPSSILGRTSNDRIRSVNPGVKMTDDEIKRLIKGRDECWNDLVEFKNHYNDLRNKAIELGLKFEDIDPAAIKLHAKIVRAELMIKHPGFIQAEIPRMSN